MYILFEYQNIKFRQHERGRWAVVSGEITNKAGRDYASAMFRLIIFKKDQALVNVSFCINGFTAGQTRIFEKQLEELNYEAMVKAMTHYEIYAESAY